MSEFKKVKCPYCGSIDGIYEHKSHYKCSYCDCEFFIVSEEYTILLNEAQSYLTRYKFEDGDDIYRKLSRDAEELENYELYAMAEWGRLLSYFGVVYVKSFNGKTSVPTFSKFDSRYSSVTESEYYSNIMDSDASMDIKMQYKEMALVLDETYSKINDELNEKNEYDVFLCVKISLATEKNPSLEGYTKDSKLADEIYTELTNRGIKVFYSEKCCQGIEYDSQILSALTKSKMLLVISTRKEYLESAWVQSEWRRWLNFIKWNEKEKNSLLLYIPNFDNGFELPTILSKKKIQCFDSPLNVVNKIYETINPVKEVKVTLEYINTLVEKGDEYFEEDLYEDAIKWYLEAAKYDSKDAYYDLGICYTNGYGVDETIDNINKGIEYYKIGAKLGNSDCYYELGETYFYGNGIDEDIDEGIKYYKLGCKENNPDCLKALGDLYYAGKGVESSREIGDKYYFLAADNGNNECRCIIAERYYKGERVEQSYHKMYQYYRDALADGYPDGYAGVGYCYLHGYGVDIDYDEAFNNLTKAYEKGSDLALYGIGRCYDGGYGTEQDMDKAIYYYEKCFNNYPHNDDTYLQAGYELGQFYNGPAEDGGDYKKAVYYFSGSRKNYASCYELGFLYLKGLGCEQNLLKARELLSVASDHGMSVDRDVFLEISRKLDEKNGR